MKKINESHLCFTLHFLSPHFKKGGGSFFYLSDEKTTFLSGSLLCEPELIDGIKQETRQGKSTFVTSKEMKTERYKGYPKFGKIQISEGSESSGDLYPHALSSLG